MAENIRENISNVISRLGRAARRVGRNPAEITILYATKGVDVKRILEVIRVVRHGVFGENYVQEAEKKIAKVKRKSATWHFIGHLQKNKAKYAVEMFDVIETVDSVELAHELSKRAKKPLDVFIEVNIGGEKTKGGVSVKDAGKLVRKISEFENIRIKGLMTIPPFSENPEASRPYFVTLRRIAERINKEHIPGVSMHELSMGMSGDFEVAVEEGATIVRIGTLIFGQRGEREKKK